MGSNYVTGAEAVRRTGRSALALQESVDLSSFTGGPVELPLPMVSVVASGTF